MTTTNDTPTTKRSRGKRGGVQYRAKRALWIANGGKHARPVPKPVATVSDAMKNAFLGARVRIESSDSPLVQTVMNVLSAL